MLDRSFSFSLAILIFTIGVFLPQNISAQQVWTKKQGEFFTAIGGNYYSYNSLLNGNEELLPLRRTVTEILLQNYTEIGIVDNFMATLIVPVSIISTGDEVRTDSSYSNMVLPAGQIAAPGNIQLGLTYGFLQDKPFRMAAKLNFGMNTASYKPEVGLRTGESTWAISPMILAGYGHKYFFTSAELGWTYRTSGYSQQLFSNTQIGTTIKDRFYIILSLNMLFVLNETDYDVEDSEKANVLQTGTYLNNRQYQAPQLRLGYDFTKNWSVWLATGGLAIAGGDNIGAAATFNLSIAYKYKPKQE